MATAKTTWILDIVDRASASLKGVQQRAGAALSNVEKIKAIDFYAVSQSAQQLNQQFQQLNQPYIALDASLKDLQAITNASDEVVEAIGEKARASAKKFGTDAAQNVESYKLILSQLSPEIAKNEEALASMGNHVNVLSKQLKGDAAAATEVMTTAMNQYGVSLDDPIKASDVMAKMMHAMSAAAQEGSAELPQIKRALEQAGLTAKSEKVSFEELNAAIQVADKAGKKGSEGGVAIRNTLATLAQGRFLPREVRKELDRYGISVDALADKNSTFKKRLELLKPVIHDGALISKLFGKENQAAALALIQGTDEMGRLTTAITGTNSATVQADIVMGSWQERINRMRARMRDFMITIGEYTTPFQPAIEVTSQLAVTGASMGSIYSGMAPIFRVAGTATLALAGKVRALTVAFLSSPIGWITAGLAAIAALSYGVYKAVEKQREAVLRANPAWREQQAILRVNASLKKEVATATAGQITQLELLTRIATDENGTLAARRKALDELIAIDPRYKEALNGDLILTEKLRDTTAQLTTEIRKNAEMQGRRKLIESLAEEKAQKQLALLKMGKEITAFDFQLYVKTGMGKMANYLDLNKEISDLNDDMKAVSKDIARDFEYQANPAAFQQPTPQAAGPLNKDEKPTPAFSPIFKLPNPTGFSGPSPELNNNNNPNPLTGANPSPLSASGNNTVSSGGSGKSISMVLNITNHFKVVGDKLNNNIEELADQFAGRMNDRLRDGLIALEAS